MVIPPGPLFIPTRSSSACPVGTDWVNAWLPPRLDPDTSSRMQAAKLLVRDGTPVERLEPDWRPLIWMVDRTACAGRWHSARHLHADVRVGDHLVHFDYFGGDTYGPLVHFMELRTVVDGHLGGRAFQGGGLHGCNFNGLPSAVWIDEDEALAVGRDVARVRQCEPPPLTRVRRATGRNRRRPRQPRGNT